MNPVRTYDDFRSFMKEQATYNGEPIPLLLIKPSVLKYLIKTYRLDEEFRYFNERTGNNVIFFLPGYSHYPALPLGEIFSPILGDEEIAFDYRDYNTGELHQVLYSNKNFVNFITRLEDIKNDFRYYGDTELLLPKYIVDRQGDSGCFDAETLKYRYNLSDLYNETQKIKAVSRFFEKILESLTEHMRRGTTESEECFYNTIDDMYEGCKRYYKGYMR